MIESTYNKVFFNEFYAENGGGNYTDRNHWMPFFSGVADKIVEQFNPKSVLDAGCALGYIVEALRDRGVEAYGFDISEYAIEHVREDIKSYCFIHSITEKIPDSYPQNYDLVITVEVLEHLFPEMGSKAISNLCQYSNTILFSSTPDDITDRTHVNVQLQEYWAKEFARNGFYRELTHPVSFLSPWAMLFSRKDDIPTVIFDYEMNLRINKVLNQQEIARQNQEVAGLNQEVAGLNQEIARQNQEVAGLNQEIARQNQEIAGLNQEIARQNQEIARLNQKNQDLEREREIVLSSTSWKVTAPFRKVMGFIKYK